MLSRPEPAKKKGNRLLHRVIRASGPCLSVLAMGYQKTQLFWTAPMSPCLCARAKISSKGLLYFFRSRSALTCQISNWETRPIRHPLKTLVNCWPPGRVLTVLLICVSSRFGGRSRFMHTLRNKAAGARWHWIENFVIMLILRLCWRWFPGNKGSLDSN